MAQSWGLLAPKSGSVIHKGGAGLLAAPGGSPISGIGPACPSEAGPAWGAGWPGRGTAGPACLVLSPECSHPQPRLGLRRPTCGLSPPLDDWSGPLESQRPSDDRHCLWVGFQRLTTLYLPPGPLCTVIHPSSILTTSDTPAAPVKLVCHSQHYQPLGSGLFLPSPQLPLVAQTVILLTANTSFTGHLPLTSLARLPGAA